MTFIRLSLYMWHVTHNNLITIINYNLISVFKWPRLPLRPSVRYSCTKSCRPILLFISVSVCSQFCSSRIDCSHFIIRVRCQSKRRVFTSPPAIVCVNNISKWVRIMVFSIQCDEILAKRVYCVHTQFWAPVTSGPVKRVLR